MSKITTAIIDYKLSNLKSVKAACDYVGLNAFITSDFKKVLQADSIILPGVGSFKEAMKNLKELDLDKSIIESINKKKYFLGICLGMQLLFTKSEEFGNAKGLNLIEGEVVKFKSQKNFFFPIPHVGWNNVKFIKNNNICDGLDSISQMYFVHSYYAKPKKKNVILSETKYCNINFCSSVSKQNIFAFQFHPEKSGEFGLKVYKNYLNIIQNDKNTF